MPYYRLKVLLKEASVLYPLANAQIDIVVSQDGQYVYQLYGRVGVIGVYEINADGGLS